MQKEVRNLGFKKAREGSGLTQQEAAIRIGVDQSTVCLWEIGKTKPRASLLPKIASIYGCSVDELLAEQEETAQV